MSETTKTEEVSAFPLPMLIGFANGLTQVAEERAERARQEMKLQEEKAEICRAIAARLRDLDGAA